MRVLPAPPPPSRVSVAAVEVVQAPVEVAQGEAWLPVAANGRVSTGDRLRTGPGAVARLRLPWTTVLLAPETLLAVSRAGVLSTALEAGRVEQQGERGIVKLDAGGARIRGRGHLVVRRHGATTAASVLAGSFSLHASGRTLGMGAGQGAVWSSAAPARVEALPVGPHELSPGLDPLYVRPGQPVTLSWSPAGERAHVQVFGVDDRVLLARDVDGGDRLQLPPLPLGTYRWRVSTRDVRGLEGLPSREGAFCVVEE